VAIADVPVDIAGVAEDEGKKPDATGEATADRLSDKALHHTRTQTLTGWEVVGEKSSWQLQHRLTACAGRLSAMMSMRTTESAMHIASERRDHWFCQSKTSGEALVYKRYRPSRKRRSRLEPQ